MTKNTERLNDLFEELVPMEGKAENLAGELVRATARIGYRFYNDGDHLNIGYGRETCNPAGRFLVAKTPREIGDLVAALWGMESDDGYEAVLDILVGKVADYIEAHPELREQTTEDMWSHRNECEDVEDYEDDEDDYFEEEDYEDEEADW